MISAGFALSGTTEVGVGVGIGFDTGVASTEIGFAVEEVVVETVFE